MTLPVHILAQVLTEHLLNSLVVGVIFAGLVWTLLRLVGRQNAGTRFAVWFSALLAVVAFPFFSQLTLAHLPLHANPAAAPHGEIVLSSAWASYLFAAWIAGAGLLLLRFAVGIWGVHAVHKSCTKVDVAALDPAIAEILRTCSSRCQVSLCTSSRVAVPAAVGLFRPAIVFPEWLFPRLSTSEIEMIVRHEVAHLARWDDWTNFTQKLVKAVFFFHPAVWWIENRLSLEREMACDDMVLAQSTSPRDYASSLISFAEKLHCARGLALAQSLVSRMHQMSLRVARILDAKRPTRTGLWKPVLGLNAGLLAVVLAVVPYVPPVVAFQSQPSSTPALGLTDAMADGTAGRSLVVPAALRQVAPSRPKVIPAALHPRTSSAQTPVRARVPQKPLIVRTSSRQQPVVQQTLFILRGPQLDASGASGSQVWTLCIWTVRERNLNVRQWESAIVVGWI